MRHFILKDGSKKTFSRMEMMGIINVTPDSFYSGSRVNGTEEALAKAGDFISEGATFIDVGGESTRPGAKKVSICEEIERVCPVISRIKKKYPEILVSVDTYNAPTAAAAVEAGADIVNDISGLTFDENMVDVVAATGVPVIIMHTQGRPDVMQKNPHYDNVVKEVYEYLEKQRDYAVARGVDREKIIIDLGIGFGKRYEHNVELLRNIDVFAELNCPHLLAISRKSFIGTLLNQEDPEDRLFGTVAVTLFARMHGIEMARVHDVKENLWAVRMLEELACDA